MIGNFGHTSSAMNNSIIESKMHHGSGDAAAVRTGQELEKLSIIPDSHSKACEELFKERLEYINGYEASEDTHELISRTSKGALGFTLEYNEKTTEFRTPLQHDASPEATLRLKDIAIGIEDTEFYCCQKTCGSDPMGDGIALQLDSQ
jgi:hypothetical protein